MLNFASASSFYIALGDFWHPIKDINMASKNQSSRLTFAVMMDVATTALQVLGSELFKQLTAK